MNLHVFLEFDLILYPDSDHGIGKGGSVARFGGLLGDFVDKESDYIRVVVYRIRFQIPDGIVNRAKVWAEGKFREGEYNLLLKNCQHFARLCAIGHEESGDIKKILSILAGIGMFLAFGILVL